MHTVVRAKESFLLGRRGILIKKKQEKGRVVGGRWKGGSRVEMGCGEYAEDVCRRIERDVRRG